MLFFPVPTGSLFIYFIYLLLLFDNISSHHLKSLGLF